jgi:membrane-associated phospholipid phosphatase
MEALTDFGDAALLLPLSLLILFWLLLTRPLPAAGWWVLAVFIGNAVTAVLKIYFFACPPFSGMHSPSGHTSFSIIAYGGLAALVALDRPSGWRRIVIAAASGVFVVAIALSRLALGRHTVPEVISGFVIGIPALALFVRHYRPFATGRASLALVALALPMLAILHGLQLHSEDILHDIANWLGIRAFVCG